MYRISFRKSAIKELQRLPTFAIKNISEAIDKLSEDPRPEGCKKLAGSRENMWRYVLAIIVFCMLLKNR